MTAAYLRVDVLPHVPSRTRAVLVMAALGALTGIISSLPSPLPDIRLTEPDILINASTVPLHAGIAFGAMLALVMWLWVSRDLAKCLLVMALVLMGWLAAVNTASDVYSAFVGSTLYGTAEGAKESRETLAWLFGGVSGGAVGAGLTAFGVGVPALAMRHVSAWAPVVAVGAALGLLLYPAAIYDALPLLLVPWQALVAATIAYHLTKPKA